MQQTCIGNQLSNTGCQIEDVKCICSDASFIQGLSCCIAESCDAADQSSEYAPIHLKSACVLIPSAAVIQFADTFCSGFVPLISARDFQQLQV
jgi:hypothetical protein